MCDNQSKGDSSNKNKKNSASKEHMQTADVKEEPTNNKYLKMGSKPGWAKCTLCDTNDIHLNNISVHFEGKQHRTKRKNEGKTTSKPTTENDDGEEAAEDGDVEYIVQSNGQYKCVLCTSPPMSEAEMQSHVTDKKHKGKLIQNRVAKLCIKNKPHYSTWIADFEKLSCSLCNPNRSMTYKEGCRHFYTHTHQENLHKLNARALRLNISNRARGGEGTAPIMRSGAYFPEELKEYPLSEKFSAIANIDDFPYRNEIVSAITQLTEASKEIKQHGGAQSVKSATNIDTIRKMLHDHLFIEEAMARIELKNYNQPKIALEREGGLYKVMLPGVAESRPSVLRGDRLTIHQDDCSSSTGVTFTAFVYHVNVDSILFSMPDYFVYQPDKNYSLIFDYDRRQERKLHRAVDRCPDTAMLFLDSTIATRWTKPPKTTKGALKTINALNKNQQAFINHVQGPTRLSALWGPPGTGKTTTLVAAIVDILLRQPSTKILVCTPSNEAADLIVERLLKNVELKYKLSPAKDLIVRIHGATRDQKSVSESVRKVSPRFYNNTFDFPSNEDITSKRIVVTTLMSSDKLFAVGIPGDHFTHLFVDEAGHASEQLLMVALNATRGDDRGPCKTKVVLAGDPKQLGPRVTIPELTKFDMYMSPLQRIQEDGHIWPTVGYQLTECYRSHSAIVDLINACYDNTVAGKLKSDDNKHPSHKLVASEKVSKVNQFAKLWTSDLLRGPFYWPNHLKNEKLARRANPEAPHSPCPKALNSPSQPILCLTHTHPDQKEGDSPSWMNQFEIFKVVELVEELRRLNLVPLKQIAVITPYRKQVQRITQKLYEVISKNFEKEMITKDPRTRTPIRPRIPVKVSTVDNFQGRESQVVIVSCVRSAIEAAESDQRFGIGFLKQPERTNVALSRAKQLLIIIGNRKILSKDATWHEYFWRLDEMNKKNPGVVMNLGGPKVVSDPKRTSTKNQKDNDAVDGMHELVGKH